MLTLEQINLLGIGVSGDVDGLTIYTDRRGRKVAFPKSPPTKPWSAGQLAWKANLAYGMKLWRNLTPDQRLQYRKACDLASLCMLGHNLWLHCYLTQDLDLIATLCAQYRLNLVPPPALV